MTRHAISPFRRGTFAGALLITSLCATLEAQTVQQPLRAVTDPGVITTRQAITPAGIQTVFDGRVFGVTFGKQPGEVWVLTGRTKAGKPQLYHLDWRENVVRTREAFEGTPALQGLSRAADASWRSSRRPRVPASVRVVPSSSGRRPPAAPRHRRGGSSRCCRQTSGGTWPGRSPPPGTAPSCR